MTHTPGSIPGPASLPAAASSFFQGKKPPAAALCQHKQPPAIDASSGWEKAVAGGCPHRQRDGIGHFLTFSRLENDPKMAEKWPEKHLVFSAPMRNPGLEQLELVKENRSSTPAICNTSLATSHSGARRGRFMPSDQLGSASSAGSIAPSLRLPMPGRRGQCRRHC